MKKPKSSAKSEDQIMVTRAILEDVKRHLSIDIGRTDEQVLAWMRQMTGRPVVLVDEMPTDEDVVVICALEPVLPDSRVGKCSKCGAPVFHSRHVPPEAKKICTRCGPRLGH